MRCNIIYKKREEERTWNLRKDRKRKRRAEEPAGRKRQLVLEKRSEVDALRLEPRTVRLLAKSALLTHLWLRMPSALSRMLVILQRKEPADMKRQLIHEKKKRSGRSGTRTQDRPVMSRMLWPTELSVQNVIIFNCYLNRKRRLITPGYSPNLLLHLWLRTPYGVEPDALTTELSVLEYFLHIQYA